MTFNQVYIASVIICLLVTTIVSLMDRETLKWSQLIKSVFWSFFPVANTIGAFVILVGLTAFGIAWFYNKFLAGYGERLKVFLNSPVFRKH